MPQKIINHIVNPDGTIIELHDHERGQANGVALLNAQSKNAQTFNGYAVQLASPDGEGSIVDFIMRNT